jgi:hypothetical protein
MIIELVLLYIMLVEVAVDEMSVLLLLLLPGLAGEQLSQPKREVVLMVVVVLQLQMRLQILEVEVVVAIVLTHLQVLLVVQE